MSRSSTVLRCGDDEISASAFVIEHGARIMKRFDPDLVDLLRKGCASRDIAAYTDASVRRVTSIDGLGAAGHDDDTGTGARTGKPGVNGRVYRVDIEDGRSIETDLVVAALGRTPNVGDFGLEHAGVQCGRRGIITDKRMRTSAPVGQTTADSTRSIWPTRS